MEDPVNTVLVVRRCEDVRDDELATSCYNDRIVTKISMLEENAGIFFVNANGILDRRALSSSVDKCSLM
jgi:hypothetical protein